MYSQFMMHGQKNIKLFFLTFGRQRLLADVRARPRPVRSRGTCFCETLRSSPVNIFRQCNIRSYRHFIDLQP